MIDESNPACHRFATRWTAHFSRPRTRVRGYRLPSLSGLGTSPNKPLNTKFLTAERNVLYRNARERIDDGTLETQTASRAQLPCLLWKRVLNSTRNNYDVVFFLPTLGFFTGAAAR